MKKRFDRLLLCGLIVCSLTLPVGFADGEDAADPAVDAQPQVTQAPATPEPATPKPISEETTSEPTQEPTSEPTQEPTSEPTQEPTSEPTQEPTSEPTQEPTSEPTQEPTSEPTQEPTSEPTQEPTSEPTEEPTSEPTEEPTSEPTEEPTAQPTLEPSLEPSDSPSASPEPDATPRPLPGSIDGLVRIAPEGSAQQEKGVWRIQLSAPENPLSFTWAVDGDASGCLLYIQGEQTDMRFIAETSDMRIDLSSADYANGQHTLYVGACLADGSVVWGKITFELASQQAGRPGGGFFGGGRPSGSRPSGSASMGEMPQEEQGFKVTPGEALTSKHASGTKNTAAYTHSQILDSGEAVTALVLDSTQAEITLDNGAAFFVSKEDGKLQLIPESDGEKWQLNVLAMNTLAESSISRVVFHVGGYSYSLPTRMEFSGNIYASLRAKGYVSKDMEIQIDIHGMRVQIAGSTYSISDDGELIPCEE